MRDLVYYIATTLDGFIAREDGSFADFPWDAEFGAHILATFPETFPAHLRPGEVDRSGNKRFDAVLMGRKTYEVGLREGITSPYPTLDQFVFSRSMTASPDRSVRLVPDDPARFVAGLKGGSGGAIWICGGGQLATALFEADLIDELIVKLNPIVFGSGISLFNGPQPTRRLTLSRTRHFPSGHVWLEYRVRPGELSM